MVEETISVCIGYDNNSELTLLASPAGTAPLSPPKLTVVYKSKAHFRIFVKSGLSVTFADSPITWYDPTTDHAVSRPSNISAPVLDNDKRTLMFEDNNTAPHHKTANYHFWLDMVDGDTPIRIGGPTKSNLLDSKVVRVDPTIVDVGDQGPDPEGTVPVA